MKSIFVSKTFWFNLLSAVAVILAMPEVTGVLTPETVKYAVGATAVINILLRLITKEPVSVTGTGDGQ